MSFNCGRDEIFDMISHNENDDLLIEKLKQLQDVNVTDDMGVSYLHVATLNHEINAIKILLDKGANPNCVDRRGKTPISYAIGVLDERNAQILREFLKHGADLNMMMGDVTIKERIYEFEVQDLIDVLKEFEQE